MHSRVRAFACASAQSLVDLVRCNADFQPDQVFLCFDEREYTYAHLLTRSESWGSFFRSRDLHPGDRAVLLLDNSADFYFAFFGALMAGATVVSVSPKSKDNRIADIVTHCEAKVVVAHDSLWKSRPDLQAGFSAHSAAITVEDLPSDDPATSAWPLVSPDSPAFLQYTSGTTGDSKGVIVSHRAVLANLRSMNERFPIDPENDVFTSMLPLYHDMGLVGFALYSLYTGTRLVLFLQDIRSIYSWLESFSKHRATISGASNTMLFLTRRAVADPTIYDLSTLRAMLCGSEPLFSETLSNFQTDFGVSRVLMPAYGLAEATLCLTMLSPGSDVAVDASGAVACGRPLADVTVTIDSPDAHGVGEVVAQSPALMSGYFRNPSRTDEVLRDGRLWTGDLGYLDSEGNLFVLGRKKNVIIRDGENLLPGELEEVALRDAEVRNACVVGLPSLGGGKREQIVLVAEIRKGLLADSVGLRDLHSRILGAAKTDCNYLPDLVHFVSPTTIPFSPNGKMQHQMLKAMILEQAWVPYGKTAN